MTATALAQPRFVRRTQLGPNEYRRNFRQIDGDVISVVTSPEADRVTPLMSKIYLRLVHASSEYWERDGVLHFQGEVHGNTYVKAWDALCEAVGVASATARKALLWMHEQGIIGYFAGKNGVGIRIFLNRASSSIGNRAAGKKILDFPRASPAEPPASTDEAAFNDSYADLEVLEKDLNPRAPKSGAGQIEVVKKTPLPDQTCALNSPRSVVSGDVPPSSHAPLRVELPIEEIVSRLRHELEPSLQSTARLAAAQEHQRTREWLESKGLPKAARVAQREAYNVLRQHGRIPQSPRRADPGPVGVRREQTLAETGRLSSEEAKELAETCVAMLEVHGQGIDTTLSHLSAEAGGPLLAEDVPRVRELAVTLAGGGRKE